VKILVLGCGPAGLMAAHAGAMNGHDVVIVSKKRKSEMFGCQYLHRPIPLMSNGPSVNVRYDLLGTFEEYRQKVYGPDYRGTVSPEDLGQDHAAWDIRQTYSELWDTYGSYVIDRDLSLGLHPIAAMLEEADKVYSSIPAKLLCHNASHNFFSEQVWAVGDAPERGVFSPVNVAEFTVLCNGTDQAAWYRAANVFGYTSVEWPGRGRRPPFEAVSAVLKPLRTDCDCNPKIERVGRYGKWQKGILSHEAFEQVEIDLGQWRLF